MEEENNTEEDGPTTSKNLKNKSTDDQSSQKKNSEVSESDTFSNASGIKMATVGKKRSEKKAKQRSGRVEKRKAKRKGPIRKTKNKERKKKRDLSISTIFTRLPSSGSHTPVCNRCGHRCCLRRSKYELEKRYDRSGYRKRKRALFCGKTNALYKRKHFTSVCVQAGSRSKMLSPLFISTNSSPRSEQEHSKTYCEITPEMIHQSMRRLTMWKQEIPAQSILEHLMLNYPVGSDKVQVMPELLEKLRIAEILGIVSCSSQGLWSMGHSFREKDLNDNHVTLFWKAYADTLTPLNKPMIH